MASGAFAKKYLKRPVSRPRYKGEVKVNMLYKNVQINTLKEEGWKV